MEISRSEILPDYVHLAMAPARIVTDQARLLQNLVEKSTGKEKEVLGLLPQVILEVAAYTADENVADKIVPFYEKELGAGKGG